MSQWVRLWEDMPTDPKWRVIAKRAGRPISEVIAVFTHMLINAGANATDRGTLSHWCDEDVAAALDIEVENVEAICRAMEGKVLNGLRLSGWDRFKGPAQMSRPYAAEWEWLRLQTFERDDYTCAYCGTRGGRLECDHIVPVSRGGGNDLENLTTACFSCNRSKGTKLVEEWTQ